MTPTAGLILAAAFCLMLSNACSARRLLQDTPVEGQISFLNNAQGVPGSRLQIYHNGVWGSVCYQNQTLEFATAVCRSVYGSSIFSGLLFPAGLPTTPMDNVPIWDLLSVNCTADSPTLYDCPGWNTTTIEVSSSCPTNHSEDAAIDCLMEGQSPSNNNGDIVLSNDSEEGKRVKLYINGQWGSVCSSNFTLNDATAACKQVYGAGGQVFAIGRPVVAGPPVDPSDVGPSWDLDLQCTGEENSLSECPGALWFGVQAAPEGSFCANNSNDVAVQCAIAGVVAPSPSPTPPKSQCQVAASCDAGYTGKAENLCDPKQRSFVICQDGTFVKQQVCWKKYEYSATEKKCVPPCNLTSTACPAGFSGKKPNPCDATNRTFVMCSNGKFVKKSLCWKGYVFSAAAKKCVEACQPSVGCPADYTGKAANLCDPSNRTFIKCEAGTMNDLQTCWKQQVFDVNLRKCVAPAK